MSGDWTEQLYRSHGPLVFRRARALLGNDAAAWDAVQEVFMRAVRSESSFRRESSPSTWLYRVTTNYCLNAIRDSTRQRSLLADAATCQGEGLSDHAHQAASGRLPELRVLLASVLERVPAELCEIAIYYHVDRMNQDEIAAIVGTSRKTVGNRLREFLACTEALMELPQEAAHELG